MQNCNQIVYVVIIRLERAAQEAAPSTASGDQNTIWEPGDRRPEEPALCRGAWRGAVLQYKHCTSGFQEAIDDRP
jgi:hypothetical protein